MPRALELRDSDSFNYALKSSVRIATGGFEDGVCPSDMQDLLKALGPVTRVGKRCVHFCFDVQQPTARDR